MGKFFLIKVSFYVAFDKLYMEKKKLNSLFAKFYSKK